MADPKSLADWLNTDSDSDTPKPIRRKSSHAYAFQGMDQSTTSNPSHQHHVHSATRGRSPNAPSLSTDSPMRRAGSRHSLRRSSSRASLVVGPIRGIAATSPPDPPLPSIDVNKAKRQQEADERKKRMEEMKAKLRETLGDAADKVSMLKPQSEPPASAVPHKGVAASDEYSSDFGSQVNPLPSHLPPLSARSSMDFNRRAQLHNSYTATPPKQVVVETEVMLADRGTQTACEVEVQTDPDPMVASCPQCYKETYGHVHPGFFGCGHAGSPSVVAAASAIHGHGGGGMLMGMGTDPIFAKLMASRIGSALSYPMMPSYGHTQQPTPMGHMAHPDQWREQLGYIESSIDMLIRRYNLPPPPGMERYQPVGM